MDMYGVKYKWFVGDGDSSTYKKILDDNPYGDECQVEKIECSNHLLRNFCFSLEEIAKKGDNHRRLKRGETKGLRLNLQRKILKMRTAVKKAAEHWHDNDEAPLSHRVLNLKKDILNCPFHIFGEHKNCAKYFCDGQRKKFETNLVKALEKVGLWEELEKLFQKLAGHSRGLLHCMNNNAVENLNSIICKFLGGKRKNFTQRSSYPMRLAVSVVSKNTDGKPFRDAHKKICNNYSPGRYAKQYEERISRRRQMDKERLALVKRRRQKTNSRNADYGDAVQKIYRVREDILAELKEEALRWEELERDTRKQSAVNLWRRLRLFRLTASNFGKVCKRKNIPCDPLVKSLLYGEFQGSPDTDWGKLHESTAIAEFCKKYNVKVNPAGLFIDLDLHFLGASPDGVVVDGQGLLEVKCPSAFRNFTPEFAVRNKCNVAFKFVNNEIVFDTNHDHYYQMQGQMHIARKSYCWYVVWTKKGCLAKRVDRDDSFWNKNMEGQLSKFYNDCLLVEIVEQNYLVGKPIKNPSYLCANKPKTGKRAKTQEKKKQGK